MSYYIGDIAFIPSDELAHHGIKGQKWGVRRFQNEDGSLTAEGKERYGGKETFKKGIFGSAAERIDTNRLDWKRHKDEQRLEKAKAKGDTKKIEKAESRLEKTKATRANLEAYQARTSTLKMVGQDMLLGIVGGQKYREVRANGGGRAQALIRSQFVMPYTRIYQMIRGEDYNYKNSGKT